MPPPKDRFTLIGRRRRVPRNLQRVAGFFVDRLAKSVLWYALAYVCLSLVDTAFTFDSDLQHAASR